MKIKSVLSKLIAISIILFTAIIIVLSTTGFSIHKNSMDHFFSQHAKIDTSLFEEDLTREEIVYDIDYLINTIEEVHPVPYSAISKEDFYYLADSIKQETTNLTRGGLFNKLVPLINSLKDGHTQIKFPEISAGQDNKANFDKAHQNSNELIQYRLYSKSIGYLFIKDFAADRTVFFTQIDSIFKQIKTDSVEYLILDIRNNPGGNSELADYLVSHIYDKPYQYSSKIQIKRSRQYYDYMQGYFSWWFRPFSGFVKTFRDYEQTPMGELFNDIKGTKNPVKTAYIFSGKKILLINGNTFSTALGFATIFKDHKIGTIIGEETKAAVNGFGDMYPFDLPNSGIWVWCSTKRYIRPSGEYTDGGLQPDIFVADTDDSVIDYTLKIIQNNELQH